MMIQAIVTDFSRVLLFPVDESYTGGLNALNNKLLAENPDYDFWEYFKLNEELLEFYAGQEIPVYIFTSDSVQDHPAVKDMLCQKFQGVISAKKLSIKKTDIDAYVAVAEKLSIISNKQREVPRAEARGM